MHNTTCSLRYKIVWHPNSSPCNHLEKHLNTFVSVNINNWVITR